MKDIKTLAEAQAERLKGVETENRLETLFSGLTGVVPSIISPGNDPFASFYPQTKGEYLSIVNAIKPTDNFVLSFAGKASIPTFSPYSLKWQSESETYIPTDVTLVYQSEICPIWVKLPDEVKDEIGFETGSRQGDRHIGFGEYNRIYTLFLSENNRTTTKQRYWGGSVTMYAATPDEAITLSSIVKLN